MTHLEAFSVLFSTFVIWLTLASGVIGAFGHKLLMERSWAESILVGLLTAFAVGAFGLVMIEFGFIS